MGGETTRNMCSAFLLKSDGLSSIKFSREKTLERVVVISPPPAKQFGKSKYSMDSRICRAIVRFIPNLDKK